MKESKNNWKLSLHPEIKKYLKEDIKETTPISEFTDQVLFDTVHYTLRTEYYKFEWAQDHYELEDLVQDCIMWFYMPTRTGALRLKQYKDRCKTLDHFINTVIHGCKQYMPAFNRYREVGNLKVTSSLNKLVSPDGETEVIDLLPNEEESVIDQVKISCILQQLTEEQRELIKDLTSGYTKASLWEKYSDLYKRINNLRDDVYEIYVNSGLGLLEEFGIKYEPVRVTQIKDALKHNIDILWQLFKLTGDPKYFMELSKQRKVISRSI